MGANHAEHYKINSFSFDVGFNLGSFYETKLSRQKIRNAETQNLGNHCLSCLISKR